MKVRARNVSLSCPQSGYVAVLYGTLDNKTPRRLVSRDALTAVPGGTSSVRYKSMPHGQSQKTPDAHPLLLAFLFVVWEKGVGLQQPGPCVVFALVLRT